jgi:TolB-like protein
MKPLPVLVLVLCTPLLVAEAGDKPTISVLDFGASDVSKAEVDVFVDFITSHIVEIGDYRVIDRNQRETILGEIEFSYSDGIDDSTQLEIGKLLAANLVIFGSLGKVGGQFILNIKVLEVRTGETLKSVSEVYRSMDDLVNDSKRLTYILLDERPESGRRRSAGKDADRRSPSDANAIYISGDYEFGDADLYITAYYSRMLTDFLGLNVGFGLGIQYNELTFLGGMAIDLSRFRIMINAGYDTFAGALLAPAVLFKIGHLVLVLDAGISARFLFRVGGGVGVVF